MPMNAARVGATFATGVSVSTGAIYLADAKRVAIEVATFGSGLSVTSTIMYLQVAQDSSGPFRRLQDMSGSTAIGDWQVPSFEGDRVVVCGPAPGFNYCKVELNATTTHTFGCWVHLKF